MALKPARCFVALRLGDEVAAELGRVTARLARHGAGVRWVRAADIHLTLKFLGSVPRERLEEIRSALRGVRRGAIELGVSGLGRFPERGAPRVLWAGLDGDVDGLGSLAEDIERELGGLGFPREKRPFRPHLTLGRVKSARGLEALEAEIERAEVSCDRVQIASFELFESVLLPEGPQYSVLESFPLAG